VAGDISRPIGRTYFYSVNFAKRSICVDTSQLEGKEVVAALAATCDVLLANVRPGATERMGIGPQVNDKLIETHVTGYGFTGPSSHRPGIDPLAQALIGLERAQGGQGNPPSFQAQLAPTDFTTGAMAALGTVLSLFARSRVDSAQRVEVNLLDGGILLSSQWFTRYVGRPERPLADREQYGLNPFHRLYRVEDGFLYVVADTGEHRASLAAMLGQADPGPPGPVDPDGVHPNDTAEAAAFVAAFASYNLASAGELLKSRGIPYAPAVSGASAVFFDDPHTHANDLAVTRQHPTAGRLTVTSRYVAFGNTAAEAARATPLLGQHTEEILEEAGFAREEIERFYADGLVKTEA
jgi:crotonobetainyl-CoA:carnitine CoA-transferase CaiB-like acyl-CoA transferase